MSRSHRKKASEVFRDKDLLFGRKVPFEEAYPMIEDITVKIKEGGQTSGLSGEAVYRMGSTGEFIDCSNPICYNGGFSLGEILRDMVRNKQADLETRKFCQGYEGSPQGKRRYRSCINSFNIKVHIDYKKAKETKEGKEKE